MQTYEIYRISKLYYSRPLQSRAPHTRDDNSLWPISICTHAPREVLCANVRETSPGGGCDDRIVVYHSRIKDFRLSFRRDGGGKSRFTVSDDQAREATFVK